MWLEQFLLCHLVNSARKEYCLVEGIHPEYCQQLVLGVQNDTLMLSKHIFILINEIL
jgi:hypothetical protein